MGSPHARAYHALMGRSKLPHTTEISTRFSCSVIPARANSPKMPNSTAIPTAVSPSRRRRRGSHPQLLCENVYQMVKRPFRIVPAFPGNNSLGQIHQSDGIAPDAEFHIPPGQLRIEQPVQHLGDALMKGFLFQASISSREKTGSRKAHTARRPAPGFPAGHAGRCRRPGYFAWSHTAHSITQWHCSRKCCPPSFRPAPVPAIAAPGRPALNVLKSGGHFGNSVQIAAQGNVLSAGVKLHKMKNVVAHGVQGGLLPGELRADVVPGHAAGLGDGTEHIIRQVAAVVPDGAAVGMGGDNGRPGDIHNIPKPSSLIWLTSISIPKRWASSTYARP